MVSKGLHYSFGDESDSAMNATATVATSSSSSSINKNDLPTKGETSHIVFPLIKAMDRIVVTPPGETPPKVYLIAITFLLAHHPDISILLFLSVGRGDVTKDKRLAAIFVMILH